MQQAIGNRATGDVLSVIQPKLRIGAPDDRFEAEADRMADAVMRMPASDEGNETEVSRAPVAQAQRMCAECAEEEEEKLRRQPREEEEEEEELLQSKTAPGAPREPGCGIERQVGNIRAGGQPLAPAVRSFFEPRFGHDFSGVRVHNSGAATQAARSINARAFTLGRDIVFGAGEYAPESRSGRRLLAHELTHVIQQTPLTARRRHLVDQRREAALVPDAPSVTSAADDAERTAVGAFPAILSGRPVQVRRVATQNIQRQEEGVPDQLQAGDRARSLRGTTLGRNSPTDARVASITGPGPSGLPGTLVEVLPHPKNSATAVYVKVVQGRVLNMSWMPVDVTDGEPAFTGWVLRRHLGANVAAGPTPKEDRAKPESVKAPKEPATEAGGHHRGSIEDEVSRQSLNLAFVMTLSNDRLEQYLAAALRAAAPRSATQVAGRHNVEVLEHETARRGLASPALARDALLTASSDVISSLNEMTQALKKLESIEVVINAGAFELFRPFLRHGVEQANWISLALETAGRAAIAPPSGSRASQLQSLQGAVTHLAAGAFGAQLLGLWIAFLSVSYAVLQNVPYYSIEHLYSIMFGLWPRLEKPFKELSSLDRGRVEAAASAAPQLIAQLTKEHDQLITDIEKSIRVGNYFQVAAALVEMIVLIRSFRIVGLPRASAGGSLASVGIVVRAGAGGAAVGTRVVVTVQWLEAVRRLIAAGVIPATVVASGIKAGIGSTIAMSSAANLPGAKGGSGAPRGRYANITDKSKIEPGRKFSDTQKKKILQANRKRNGGRLKSDDPNDPFQDLSEPTKSVSAGMGGDPQDPAMAAVDHIVPRAAGGTNAYSNARVISQYWNNILRAKGATP